MKNIFLLILSTLLLIPLCSTSSSTDTVHIGALIYNGTDAFMSDVFTRVQNAAQGKAQLSMLDSKNSQVTQNEQVETLLKEGVDALIVNLVDRTCAIYLIEMIKPYDVPVVFVNREPLYEDLCLYDKAYYVGNDPKISGALCGQLLADYFTLTPSADSNGDGSIQYMLLKGEIGHQDTEFRSLYCVRTIQENGLSLSRVAEDSARWERHIAQDITAAHLSSYTGQIECIIANNDEMALGAIEALKAAGYFSQSMFMPVVGVDATDDALGAILEGTLLGTVLNDPKGLSEAAFLLAHTLAQGKPLTPSDYPYPIDAEKYVWTDSVIITRENVQQYL